MTPQEKIMAMTDEQKETFIKKLFDTQDVIEQYPRKENGKPDFNAPKEKLLVNVEDVRFLFNEYLKLVADGVNLRQAASQTYGCLFRQTSITFNPHGRIAELKK